MPETMNMSGLAAVSSRYRDACASLADPGKTVIMPIELGHGTALICAQAAARCGAGTALIVLPPAQMGLYADMLGDAGYPVTMVGRKKGAMAEICRQLSDLRPRHEPARPCVFLAAPGNMAEAGHWLEAWPRKKPFDFVAVADATCCTNLRSERGRGIRSAADRAGTSVLVCDIRTTDPTELAKLKSAWDAEVRAMPVRPPEAASGCCVAGTET